MNFLKNILFSLFLVLLGTNIYSQDIFSDTLAIDEIVISASRLNTFSTGLKITNTPSEIIDSYNSQTIGELLSEQSQIFIKSYGNSGVASASTRGSGTNHTAVLWNGFNLQDAMNGGVNLNNIPVTFIDEIYVQQGGSGALYGSGALGGAIHFNTKLDFDKGLEISLSQKYGSYNNLFNSFNVSYSNPKFASSTRLFQQSSENNYTFINTTQINKPYEHLSNASFDKWGFQQSVKLKLNNAQEITGNIWYQDSYTEVPDMIIITSSSNQSQHDNSIRGTLEWKRLGEIASTIIRTAYFDNQNIYTNEYIDETTHNLLTSTINEIEQKVQLGSNHLINVGINNTYEKGSSEYYGDDKNRNRLSVFTSYKIFNKKNTLASTLSIRDEIVNNTATPLTYSIGVKAQLFNWLKISSNFSKNYRLPTFNELYWGNWGNPELEPEWGYSEDICLSVNKKISHHNFESNVTFFNSNVTNWIIWVPQNTIWSPQNVQKVWSRGFEYALNYTFIFKQFEFKLNTNYIYTKATNEGTVDNSATSAQILHKQLIYIPYHQLNIGIELKYKFLSLKYNEYGVSKRFTSENNTGYVDSYNIANLHLIFNFKVFNTENNLSFSIYNIRNINYQVMAWYPMPMRHYSLGYTINLNPNNRN